jgi:hypothetical protein
MDELRSRLAEWQARGLVTVDQVEAIASAEGVADPGAADRRMLEALAYVGAVLFLIGALIIAFDIGIPDSFFDDEDNLWGTFFLALATAAALGGAAWMIATRSKSPVTDRGVGLTALAAWVAFLVAAIVLVGQLIDLGRSATLIVGLALLVVAYPTYRWQPGGPTQLALAVAGVVSITGLLAVIFDETDVIGVGFGFSSDNTLFLLGGLLFAAFGLGWMLLADRRILVPRNLGYWLGGSVGLFGAQFFTNIADGWVVITLGLGIFIALSGVWKSRTLLMAIGTVYIVIGLVGLLELLFDDSALSAGIVMLLAGAAALAAVYVRADTVGPTAMQMPAPGQPTPPSDGSWEQRPPANEDS